MTLVKYVGITLLMLSFASCGDKVNTENVNTTSTEVVNGITKSIFKVWGNCDMCKETIETSLKVDGVIAVDWNVDSKMITVEYDTVKINLNQIQKNIATVGYDNDMYKGDDKAYSELANCCQYDRK